MSIAKRDVLELRRRMTKKGCTIDRLCGCYVDGGKNVVLKFSESFSDLPEEEYYKYLEIAKKAMSGSLNSNLLELNFQRGETGDEHQRYLYTLKASKMQNPELLDRLYEKIIDSYAAEGNYLILAEGTRSKNGNHPGTFKGGSFKTATKTKCPIVPVALIDSFKAFDTGSTEKIVVQVHILPPMYYEEYKDMHTTEIAEEVKRRIEKVIEENI